MKTVHRVPKSHGAADRHAAANASRPYPNVLAKVPDAEPHPDEHASLISILVMTPFVDEDGFHVPTSDIEDEGTPCCSDVSHP